MGKCGGFVVRGGGTFIGGIGGRGLTTRNGGGTVIVGIILDDSRFDFF